MRILLIGSGGREHALCWKLAQSPLVEKIFTSPGNPGTAHIEKNRNIDIPVDRLDALRSFASTEGIDLTFVGPEQPLAMGIVDHFEERSLRIVGPTKAAAQLEASKNFAKQIMLDAGIPTAQHSTFTSASNAVDWLKKSSYPIVLKADGLAAGKGVAICATYQEAKQFIDQTMTAKQFGDAGQVVIAEEYLEGEEASFLGLTDGTHWIPFVGAQDHKRLMDGEQGPNTGGMGAYSPAPVFTPELQKIAEEKIVHRLLATMAKRGTPFTGILYVGLMITSQGPKVLEFNARFGDPETQAILPRLKSDLAELFFTAARGRLASAHVEWSEEAALGIVLAAEGYPQSPKKGAVIRGVERAQRSALVFHAGTDWKDDNLVTSGGRVFTVVGLGASLKEAASKAYAAADMIQYEGKTFRRDIGWRAFQRST